MKKIFYLAIALVILLVIGGLFLDGTDILSDSILPALDTACNLSSDCTW